MSERNGFSNFRRIGLIIAVAVFWLSSLVGSSEASLADSNTYTVTTVIVGDSTEYHFKLDERHFASLIDQGGTFALRPHPGCDVNGWGSTWYAQPFLPGAVLRRTVIQSINADSSGIHVQAEGNVSRASADTFGIWSLQMDLSYDAQAQDVLGDGLYTISLPAPLDETTGDLNLYKIAGNYLDDVPLLSGALGDTGDMKEALVRKQPDQAWFTWLPPEQPLHFPTDSTSYLMIEVVGQFNNVDTQAQGYAPIAPAFKPGLKVILTSPRQELMFGGIYDLSKSQLF